MLKHNVTGEVKSGPSLHRSLSLSLASSAHARRDARSVALAGNRPCMFGFSFDICTGKDNFSTVSGPLRAVSVGLLAFSYVVCSCQLQYGGLLLRGIEVGKIGPQHFQPGMPVKHFLRPPAHKHVLLKDIVSGDVR